MMPLEKTSRWPRLVSCLGMKASSAWKLASRGKSAKHVLAASTRISIVAAWTNRNSACPTGLVPNTAGRDLRDDRLACRSGPTCIFVASNEIPRNIDAEAGAHDHQGRAGVPPLGRLEGRDAVGDRLHTGHGGAARREARAAGGTGRRSSRSPIGIAVARHGGVLEVAGQRPGRCRSRSSANIDEEEAVGGDRRRSGPTP